MGKGESGGRGWWTGLVRGLGGGWVAVCVPVVAIRPHPVVRKRYPRSRSSKREREKRERERERGGHTGAEWTGTSVDGW